MASYPLAALAVRPVETPDLLGNYGKLVALKSMMQQQQLAQQRLQFEQQAQPLQLQQQQLGLQQSQMQLDSERAVMRAYADSNGDLTAATKLASQYGALPKDVVALRDMDLGIKQKVATLDKTNLENFGTQVQQAGQAAGMLLSVPQAQRPQAFSQIAPQFGIDPSKLQPQQLDQLLSDDHLRYQQTQALKVNEQLDEHRKQLESEATLQGKRATSAMEVAKNQALQQWLTANPGATEAQYEVAQEAAKAKAAAEARLGSEMTLANYNKKLAMENMIYEHQLNGITDAFNNPQHGYSQTLSQLQATKNAVASSQTGSQLAASLAPVMTALGVASFAGMHRVNQNEINAAGPAVGSILRQIDARLEKWGEGKLAPGTAQEMSGLMDNLLDAKYSTVLSSAQLAAANGHIDPSKVYVMDKQGQTIPLSQAKTPTITAPPIRARDPQGILHEAPAGTPLPPGWKAE